MALARKDCKLIRVIINRAVLGPAWFNDEPSTPELRAVVAELRHQTREWLQAVVIRELQYMMSPDERVKLNAHMATPQPQALRHTLEAEYAARAMQALEPHHPDATAESQAPARAASASAQCSEPAPESLPDQRELYCKRCLLPRIQREPFSPVCRCSL